MSNFFLQIAGIVIVNSKKTRPKPAILAKTKLIK